MPPPALPPPLASFGAAVAGADDEADAEEEADAEDEAEASPPVNEGGKPSGK